MIKEVPIKLVRPNPFHARNKGSEAMSEQAIAALADEIKELGYWEAPLRARKRNGKFEIVWGHRRLKALTKLRRGKVVLDVQDLTDDQMLLEMAVENFQRHALTDSEKRSVWRKVKEQCGGSIEDARKILGLPSKSARDLNIACKAEDEKASLETLSNATAARAHQFGGKEMVDTARRKRMAREQIDTISRAINQRSRDNPSLAEPLKQAAKKGKISSAEDVDREARKFQQKRFDDAVKKAKKKAPRDLLKVVSGWVDDLPEIIEKLDAVASSREYADYIVEGDPKLAAAFKRQLRDLVRVAGRLEKNILLRLEKKGA